MKDNINQLVGQAPKAVDPHTHLTGQFLHTLDLEGLSYTQIAQRHGLTRGQVAGKVNRFRNRNNLKITYPKKIKKPKTQKKKEMTHVYAPSFLDVVTNDSCRYIYGDPKENPKFCAHPRHQQYAYCEGHAMICYQNG